MIEDFLTERIIFTGRTEQDIKRGCPQSSCLGPILWNILMEGWFSEIKIIQN